MDMLRPQNHADRRGLDFLAAFREVTSASLAGAGAAFTCGLDQLGV
jgi:hypothetical protein